MLAIANVDLWFFLWVLFFTVAVIAFGAYLEMQSAAQVERIERVEKATDAQTEFIESTDRRVIHLETLHPTGRFDAPHPKVVCVDSRIPQRIDALERAVYPDRDLLRAGSMFDNEG